MHCFSVPWHCWQIIWHLTKDSHWVGTVENHGENSKKTRQTFVKIAKNHRKVTAPNYGLKYHYKAYKTQHLALTTKVFICKILSLRSIKIHICTTTSRLYIERVSNQAIWILVTVAKVDIFVLKSHNKLELMLIKNEKFVSKMQNRGILAKITAFWQNHGICRKSRFPWFLCFRDFFCLYQWAHHLPWVRRKNNKECSLPCIISLI